MVDAPGLWVCCPIRAAPKKYLQFTGRCTWDKRLHGEVGRPGIARWARGHTSDCLRANKCSFVWGTSAPAIRPEEEIRCIS